MADEVKEVDTGLEPDAFDLAFEAAAGADAPGDVLEPEAKEPEAKEPEAKEPEAKEPEAKEPEAKEPEAKEPEVKEPDPVKVAADKAAAEKAETDRQAAAARVEQERKDAEAKAAADRAASEQLTEDEQKAIELHAKDFPEAHKAYEARERVLITKLTNMFKTELAAVRSELGQQIAPVAHTVATNSFQSAILQVHPDAFQIIDKVNEWVATKPVFMQQVFNDILDKAVGGAQATNELLSLYKSETGSAQTPGQSAEDKAAAAALAAAQDADKKKKLQSQVGVQSRSTQKSAAVDPEDFDGAFEKFAATA